jgi:arylsulfatase
MLRVFFLMACALPMASVAKPNFIIIFSDDQGYEDIGCFGAKQIRTPHLDRMAREGMRFTDFYAQPICGPSRAALMTGCYPLRVAERGNVKNLHPHLHSKEITIAEVLRPLGYTSGCFGKWDLGKHSQRGFHRDLTANDQGFDEFFGTPTSNDGFVDLYRNRELIEKKAPMATLTKRYTAEVISFIERNKERPFFVYLPHTMPHTKLAASDQFKGKSPRGLYGDVIEEIDDSTGRIIDTVKKHGLAERTWIIYTSDNGPWLIRNKDFRDGSLPGDHGGSAGPLRSGKVSTWEGGVRVPMIAWAPGRIPVGTTCGEIAATIDLLPTLASLAGGGVPDDRVIDGEDVSHLLRGDFAKANKERAFYYYFMTHLQGVRQGKWKLLFPRPKDPPWLDRFAKNGHIAAEDDEAIPGPFLIDLKADLGETTNVAEKYLGVVKKLTALAEAMREDLGDYNRVGKNMRFFDPMTERPKAPVRK